MAVTDFLTCGSCQTEFPLTNIVIFMEHKKSDCSISSEIDYRLTNYSCFTCPKQFGAAVSLLEHAQYQHKQSIFKDHTDNDSSAVAADSLAVTSQSSSNKDGTGTIDEATANDSADLTLGSLDSYDPTEPLSKCCSAVVPKKRKRHFETKHRSSFFKNARMRRQQPSLPSSIYIDVDQSPLNSSEGENQPGPDHQVSHSAFLEPGRRVSIPFTNSDGVGSCFGISYTDSWHGSGTYGTMSTSSSNHSLTSSVVKNPIQSAPNHQVASSALDVKKKYPTSKPFKCDHCEDSFNQRIHLKKHLSKHTGVKPYKCGQCDYATVERSHLKVHIRIHTGEKPFKCDHCEYSTAQNSTLKIHLKRHHGGSVSLECTYCGKHFLERTQLLWHTQEHGKSEPSSLEPDSYSSKA